MKQAMLNRKADINAGETVTSASFGTNQLWAAKFDKDWSGMKSTSCKMNEENSRDVTKKSDVVMKEGVIRQASHDYNSTLIKLSMQMF